MGTHTAGRINGTKWTTRSHAGAWEQEEFTQGGQSYYIASDHLGSPRVITDVAGNVVKAYSYDAWGNRSLITDNDPGLDISIGFAGGLFDGDTGLIQFGFRDYDADIGRFVQTDPLGLSAGANVYVESNPIALVDPLGLAPDWVGPASAVLGATGGSLVVIGSATANPVAAASE